MPGFRRLTTLELEILKLFTTFHSVMEISISLQHQEKDFIEACIAKERWAQKQLYEDNYTLLLGVCLRYSSNQDDAMDILHEGFIKILNNIHKYQPGTTLVGWMRRIIVNTAIDYYRMQSRRRTDDLETAYDVTTGEPDAVSQLTVKEIIKCIQQLSPAYRSVFNLYVVEGYSHKEIADILEITESTSRSNLVKARSKLKDLMSVTLGKHGK
jgi:RNA polymerase sigma-70 factor (ECF subfamily)